MILSSYYEVKAGMEVWLHVCNKIFDLACAQPVRLLLRCTSQLVLILSHVTRPHSFMRKGSSDN